MPAPESSRSRRRFGIALVASLTLALAACGSGRSAESEALIPRDPGNLNGTDWILVATGDSDAVPASTPLTLRIEDTTASGNGPCNQYHLPFTHDGNDVTTGAVASTRIACAPRLMTAEHTFFTDLEAVDTAEMEQEHLVLSGPGDVRLVFERADDPADQLTGTWNIVNVASSRDAVTTVLAATHPRLQFHSDGTLTVETGCNTGNATWTAQGSSITITEPRSTLKACAKPPGVMKQESNIFHALPRAKSVELTHDSAVLADENGATVIVMTRDD